MKMHLRPKTKMAETIKNSHFRRRKRKQKRISVGLYLDPYSQTAVWIKVPHGAECGHIGLVSVPH